MIRWLALLALLVGAVPALAEEEVLRGDWSLGCDAADCGISARTDSRDSVYLTRRGHLLAPVHFGMQLSSLTPDPGIALVLRVDDGPKLSFHPGRDFASYGYVNDIFFIERELAERVIAGMRRGSELHVFAAQNGSSRTVTFSLRGFEEALARMAQIQQRDVDDIRVAPPPKPERAQDGARPSVDAGTGPRGLPLSVVDRHYRESACEDLESSNIAAVPAKTARLSATETLYALPCTRSDAGTTWRLYRTETGEIGGVATLHFARHDPVHGWTGTDLLWNIEIGENEGTLTTRRSGKGERDCGYYARWTWRERGYRLDEARQNARCNGTAPSGWPVVYRREN